MRLIANKQAIVMHFPKLKMTVLSATFDSSTATGNDHAVTDVRYSTGSAGTWIPIPSVRRPDKMPGQSLTVNIQIRHP